MPFRSRLLTHRDNTAVLASAYPFVSDGGLGVPGPLVGREMFSGAPFRFDPFALYKAGVITNPNLTISGVVGSGKSTTTKVMATRLLLFGIKASIASDPKGEWTPLVQSLSGSVFRLVPGGRARMNPLDEGVRPRLTADGEDLTDAGWVEMKRSRRMSLMATIGEALLGRPLHPAERHVLDHAIDVVVDASNDHPRLPEIVTQLLDPDPTTPLARLARDHTHQREMGADLAASLLRLTSGDLGGMFDDYSTERFDPAALMSSIDMSALGTGHKGLHIAMTCADAWLEAAIRDRDQGRRLVIYEEGWSRVQHAALLERMRDHWKLSRYFGIANVLVLHRDSDLDASGDGDSRVRALATSLLEDTGIRIVHRQEHATVEAIRANTGMSSTEADLLPSLDQGQAIWRIKRRPFLVQTRVHPSEMHLYDTNARMAA